MKTFLYPKSSRAALMAGVSLIACGAALLAPEKAAAACSGVSSDTTFSSPSTNCVAWSGGNITVTSTGTINGSDVAMVDQTGSNPSGTLANAGYIRTTNTGGWASAVRVSGTIGALNNSGTLDGNVGRGLQIRSGGSITVLTNSGSIVGRLGLVNEGGAIATLTNSGVINAVYTYAYGLYNSGVIDTLTNSGTGTIAGTRWGLGNDGTIAVLSNSGTISSGMNGITNTGNIGTLTNSGAITVTGSGQGIDNSGTIASLNNSDTGTITGTITNSGIIGAITNSGLIAGNITNTSANALTINGGTGTVFGTLTGTGGGTAGADMGTITNTSADLVFGSGNLLLNDIIDAGSHTVFNTGATLKLANAVVISGNYSQSGGGLVVLATDSGASYGHLEVGGDVSISGATVTISGASLSVGQTYTIVDAGGDGEYTLGSITASVRQTAGLGATVTTGGSGGEDLVVTLVLCSSCTGTDSSGSGYQQKGAPSGPSGSSMGATLDSIAAAGSAEATTFQSSILTAIDALPTAQQGAAIKQLAPTQNVPSSQMSTATATAVLGAVEQHQQTAMAYDPATGAAAGSETHDSAIWGQFLGGGARRGSNAEADGYRLTDFGLAAGIDHMFSPNAMGGVALSWVRAWSEGSDGSSGSSSILDSYQLTFYGTYRLDRAFVDGQLGLGWNEFDQKRAIAFLGTTASAQYSGQQYLAKATVGYDLPVADGVTLTPLASLRWLRAVTGSYDETGAGSANLSIDKSGVTSVSQDLGAKVAWSVPTSLGNLKPEARLAWIHDYTNGPIATSGVIGGTAFAVTTPRTEADGVRVGLAASINGDDALSLRAEYEGELRAHYQSHTGIVKAIYGF